MGAKISKLDYYLPEIVIDNPQLEEEFPGWDSSRLEKKVGIKSRNVTAENETALDLARQAAKKVLKNYDKKKINFLIFCTQSPDYFFPTSACILQDQLGLPTNIGAFDFNLGCSGFVYGLAISKGLINSGTAENVLLVTGETYSKFIHPGDKANRIIFGDGAAAVIIEKNSEDHIMDFVLGTNGAGFDKLIVPNGGLRNRYNPDEAEIEDQSGDIRTNNHLFMNGREIFNFTLEAIPPLFWQVLEKNNLTLDNLAYVIFHQANRFMLEHLRQKLNIPREKFFNDILKVGNTVSSTIPIALKTLMDNRMLKSGEKVLLCGFGVGYSWGGVIVKM
jgi:3-oxoacyl-[acyl-carrier-protein] synthase-3